MGTVSRYFQGRGLSASVLWVSTGLLGLPQMLKVDSTAGGRQVGVKGRDHLP